MVSGVKLVRELVNAPVPVPLVVLLSEVSGELNMLQQIPLAVTVVPPPDVTLPPPEAVEEVIAVIVLVVTVGVVKVVKVESPP